MLGVRLLDRSPRGIEPTIYADAMLRRSVAVFDELRQSVKDVAFLADPTSGELRIGCPESIRATVLPQFIEHFTEKYPQVVVHVHDVPSPATPNALHDRRFDLIFLRRFLPLPNERTEDDLTLDYLFDDPLVIAAGVHSRWARRRSIDIAELADEPWILPSPELWNYTRVAEAFRARGLEMPKVRLFGFSVHLINHFVANGVVSDSPPEVDRALLFAEAAAGQSARAAMDGHDHDFEEPHPEPGGRAFHRMRARGREGIGERATSSAPANGATQRRSEAAPALQRSAAGPPCAGGGGFLTP